MYKSNFTDKMPEVGSVKVKVEVEVKVTVGFCRKTVPRFHSARVEHMRDANPEPLSPLLGPRVHTRAPTL